MVVGCVAIRYRAVEELLSRNVNGESPNLIPQINESAAKNGESTKENGVLPKILLISSRRRPDEWILPKGGWEKHETVEEAVHREVWEETGVRGTLLPNRLSHHSWDSTRSRECDLEFYELHVQKIEEEWPEKHERKLIWVDLDEALEKCCRWEMQVAIAHCSLARQYLEAHPVLKEENSVNPKSQETLSSKLVSIIERHKVDPRILSSSAISSPRSTPSSLS